MKKPTQNRNRVVLFFPELLKDQDPLHVPLELISLVPGLKSLGLEVKVLDERVESWSLETLAELLEGVLFVGTGSRPGGQVPRSFAFAKAVKQVAPEVPVVMGGWFPSIIPDRVAAHPAVNYVITGEGEIPIVRLATALLNNQEPAGIEGLATMRDGTFNYVPHERKSRIHDYPMPDYSILDIERYMGRMRELAYISSKGCKGNCNFCAIQCGYANEWYPLPAERVVEDVSRLAREYSLAKIRFVDANFFNDESRVIAICQGLLDSGRRLVWQAPGRVDQLAGYAESTWEAMRRSGCHAIETGVESGSNKVLTDMQKEVSRDQLHTVLTRLDQSEITGTLNYMLGYATESEADLKETLTEIMSIWQQHPRSAFAIYRFSPIPITALYNDLLGEVPGVEDPNLVEKFRIYRPKADQPWLTPRHQHVIDMVFYYYLPYALKRPLVNGQGLTSRIKGTLTHVARARIRTYNFHLPLEWWLLLLGTKAGLLNPQRFRQWAQS